MTNKNTVSYEEFIEFLGSVVEVFLRGVEFGREVQRRVG